jgi:hypothetical protein
MGERALPGSLLLAIALTSRGAAQENRAVVELGNLGDPVRLEQRLRSFANPASITIPNGRVHQGNLRIAPGETVGGNLLVIHGNAEVSGKVTGNLVTLDGDIVLQPGGVVTGDALALGGAIRDRGGVIQGERRALRTSIAARPATSGLSRLLTRAAGLAGVLLTLGLLGFGMVLFAHPQLETISDTVSHSLFRSFLTGLLAQIVVLPSLGMVVTGLVLSVVGILLVPFVLIVVPLLVLAAGVSGFLAVAHAMGEQRIRRRMAQGARVGSANSYRYVFLGLSAVAAIWAGWILFGWVPVAGTLVFAAAFLVTWLLATVGFGAALLSRGGIRPAFAGRYVPPEALTDEYLWATPQFGVDAVKRPLKKGER